MPKEDLDYMLNSVEHTLVMYAEDFVLLPAFKMYDNADIAKLQPTAGNCHIYIIGEIPRLEIISIKHDEKFVHVDIKVHNVNKTGIVSLPIPEGMKFVETDEDGAHLQDVKGNKYGMPNDLLMAEFSQQHFNLDFKVLYVGQAYGEDGKRSALERLKEHSTLQKIALQGISEGTVLQLLLININETPAMNTMFNPFAKDKNDDTAKKRITMGLDMLFGTNEEERVTLYEASFIRYFQPIYNKQLKNSFPSTNLKILENCYEKDMQAIAAEINYDHFPFRLFSDVIEPAPHHIAHFDLHKEKDRKSFFCR